MCDWKIDDVIKVINLYREAECLWNYHNPIYKRLDLKKNAWDEMALECGKKLADLKKKVKHLRTAYIAEKKKVDEAKKTGSVYQPHLFYYGEFKFLDRVIVYRKYPNEFETTNTDSNKSYNATTEYVEIKDYKHSNSCEEEEDNNSVPNSPTAAEEAERPTEISAVKNYKRKSMQSLYATIKRAARQREGGGGPGEEALFFVFGKSIALQLKQLTPIEATETMAEIQQLITEKVMQSMRAEIVNQDLLPTTRSCRYVN